jgi:hypothetical protein
MHSPKTGGTWVREVLSPIRVEWVEHGILTEQPDVPVYAFVRNPWHWHVSMYSFLNKGSEYFSKNSILPIIHALPENTFEQFIRNVCEPTAAFKSRVHAIFKVMCKAKEHLHITDQVEGQIIDEWLETDIGYYQLIHNIYTRYATFIGKHEFIRDDLMHMVIGARDHSGLIEQRIRSMPPINVTDNTQDKRSFYNVDTQELVKQSCASIIERYRYEF